MRHDVDVTILPQPDDTTCGPTCLQAVYQYYGDDISLDRTIAEVAALEEGGTLAVMLGSHALARGYEATVYTYNLALFDPTWFRDRPTAEFLIDRLTAQMAAKTDRKLRVASKSYLDFLSRGGTILFQDLKAGLIRRYLKAGKPVLAGLSSTYLYNCSRERASGMTSVYDDIGGMPTGHFVVLSGYDKKTKRVLVADPLASNPSFESHYYHVDMQRLLASILLGIVTYDANLLIVEKRNSDASGASAVEGGNAAGPSPASGRP
jgi:hypothetical protein